MASACIAHELSVGAFEAFLSGGMTSAELERLHIVATLRHFEGNKTKAAKALGISIRTLRNKVHVYQLIEFYIPRHPPIRSTGEQS